MELYKLKDFSNWSIRHGISDRELSNAIDEMNCGLVGDRLGAEVYKKRIAATGKGKRGGARAILIFRRGELAVFLFGYAKNEKSNLSPREEMGLRLFAKEFMKLSSAERASNVRKGKLVMIEEAKK